jgi:hypothetical protein
MENRIFVECSDVTDFACDVLVLKYAQAVYGADARVATLLSGTRNPPEIAPSPGQHVLLPSRRKVAASFVLFVGVLELYQFDYRQIRKFASDSLLILGKEIPDARHIAMTMHGVGYGLDEREAFSAQLAGLFDALRAKVEPSSLERITIVEKSESRAKRIKQIIKKYLPAKPASKTLSPVPPKSSIDAGLRSNVKPHVFVAMPFSEDMEDVYVFGIQGPANAAGFLCERVDMATFTGDILTRIKLRIETASLVIADLTGANANVYLEVGYAWGKERPTLLLSKKGDELKFDVKGQRCIRYKNIADLAKQLDSDLATLSEENL